MPPTRGHDLKPCLPPRTFQQGDDAPHTGARLETLLDQGERLGQTDAPHTGARLETGTASLTDTAALTMPPTRGHDLKRKSLPQARLRRGMPPTRGHDLKPPPPVVDGADLQDAPHTGARLETFL